MPPENAGAFNQALMDLGALVCTPREPGCLVCPLSSLCQARQLGLQDRLPAKTPKPLPLPVTEAAVVLVRERTDSDPRARLPAVSGSDSGNSRLSIWKGSIPPADRPARPSI